MNKKIAFLGLIAVVAGAAVTYTFLARAISQVNEAGSLTNVTISPDPATNQITVTGSGDGGETSVGPLCAAGDLWAFPLQAGMLSPTGTYFIDGVNDGSFALTETQVGSSRGCQSVSSTVTDNLYTFNFSDGLHIAGLSGGIHTLQLCVMGPSTDGSLEGQICTSKTFNVSSAAGVISVTSADSEITSVAVPATWSFVTGPQDPCMGHGGSCINQSSSTYASLDFGAYQLCNQFDSNYCHPTQTGLWALNSVKAIPIASRSEGLLAALANFGKNITPRVAMAMSTCGQFGPYPPSYCSADAQTPSLSLTSNTSQASYIILWDPIAAINVTSTIWNPTVMEGESPVTDTVTVSNAGAPGSTLTWTASSTASWLSVSPDANSSGLKNGKSGAASQDVVLTISPSGLSAAGSPYRGDVIFNGISAPGFGFSSAMVSVTLTITGVPPSGGGSGYDCVDDACSAVSSSAQYSSLSACNASCNGASQGNSSGTQSNQLPACTPGVNCPVCNPPLTANPSSIVVPESSNLSYSCSNVTECQLTQGGAVLSTTSADSSGDINSTYPVAPSITSTYTLTCVNSNYSGSGSTVTSNATVTVTGSSLCEQNPNGAGCPGAQ